MRWWEYLHRKRIRLDEEGDLFCVTASGLTREVSKRDIL